MRLSHLCLAGLVLALVGCTGTPRTPPRWSPNKDVPKEEAFHGGPNAILLQYDANHDGTLTREELVAGLKAEFDRADTNHTGCLNAAQAAAINQQRVALDQSAATPLQDWNLDGCIDYREFATAAYSLFDQLDRNSDGKITPQEFNPAGPAGRGAGGEPSGGRGGGRGGRGNGPPP